MAFIKLFPPAQDVYLTNEEIIERLTNEFRQVDCDNDAGRDYVGDMIVATLRFSDDLPFKTQQLARLQAIQERAVYVTFGDGASVAAGCCLIPHQELFFDAPDEVDGPARALVERCAAVLDYQLVEG